MKSFENHYKESGLYIGKGGKNARSHDMNQEAHDTVEKTAPKDGDTFVLSLLPWIHQKCSRGGE